MLSVLQTNKNMSITDNDDLEGTPQFQFSTQSCRLTEENGIYHTSKHSKEVEQTPKSRIFMKEEVNSISSGIRLISNPDIRINLN